MKNLFYFLSHAECLNNSLFLVVWVLFCHFYFSMLLIYFIYVIHIYYIYIYIHVFVSVGSPSGRIPHMWRTREDGRWMEFKMEQIMCVANREIRGKEKQRKEEKNELGPKSEERENRFLKKKLMTSSSAGWGLFLWAKQLSQLILSTRHGQLLIHVLVFILSLSLRTGSSKICSFQPAAENNICASRFWSCLVEAQSSQLPAAQSWRSSEPNAGAGTSAAPRGQQPHSFGGENSTLCHLSRSEASVKSIGRIRIE